MFYVYRVNSSLGLLGIDPTVVNQAFRVQMIMTGKQSGNSPQEVALWIASQLPLSIRCNYRPATVKAWIRKRKINPDDPEMLQALLELGYY